TVGKNDIEIKTNIKPQETIIVKVEAIVSLGDALKGVPTGTLENKATAIYKEKEIFDTVTNTPGDPAFEVTKVIKTLAGKPFVEGEKYNSGDELVYEIVIKNTGAGMANNTPIDDAIESLTTELAGGSIGPAFQTWSTVITQGKPTSFIEVLKDGNNKDIKLLADIDRNDTITMTVTATINSKAVGIIPKNIVTVSEKKADTPEVNPKKGELTFTKEIINGENYTQGGTIEYKLIITNLSDTFVNDVSFLDEISKIKATGLNESQVTAFKDWTVKRVDKGTGTTYIQDADITTDINDKIDISPKDVLEYTITATVNNNVVGEILNTGYVEYVGPTGVEILEREAIAQNTPGNVAISKTPISPNYLPNGEIGFVVTVSNLSKTSVANNITVTDLISIITAKKVGGQDVLAFKPGWTVSAELSGADIANSDIIELQSLDGKDINARIDLGKDTKVTITIKGTANDNIYGDIINTALFNYPEGKDEAGKKGEETAVIKNTPSVATLEKTVDKLTYNSGESLEYTIKIKNTGTSVIPNFVLSDAIGKVEGEIAGEATASGLAFVSWSKVSLIVPDTSSLLEEAIQNSTQGDTYTAKFDLGPGDEIELKLTALTKPNVFGDLENTAFGKYFGMVGDKLEEINLKETAVSSGKIGDIKLTKSVKTKTQLPSSTEYLYAPGEEVEYTFVINNTGEGWVRNVKFQDLFMDVKTKLYPNGDLGTAYESGTLSVTHSTTGAQNSVTIVESNPNLIADLDIQNGTSITFVARIRVSKDAVSKIENTASITFKTPEGEEKIEAKARIFAQIPDVKLNKTVDIEEFELSQKMIYTIVLENAGENNLIGIEGRDILQNIKAMNSLGELVYPFEPGAIITRVIEPTDSVRVTTVVGQDGNLFDNLDMRSKSKITYTIELNVKDNIVGNIINTATARVLSQDGFGEEKEYTSTVGSNPLKPTMTIEKTVVTALENDNGIINGEEVTYSIKLKTDRPVFNVKLIDKLVDIASEAGEKIFIPESIKLVSVQEAGVNREYTGNINGTTSEIGISRIDKEAVILIKATVKKDVKLKAGEKIKNIATANYDQTKDGIPDEKEDLKAEVDIVAKAPDLEITKVAKQEEILLGEEVEYTIKVRNRSTTSIAEPPSFEIVDNLSDITELSNVGAKIPVYTEWTVIGVAGPNSNVGTLPAPNTNLNIKDAIIAPSETLTYTIKAKTSLDIKSDVKKISNTAKLVMIGVPEKEAEAEIKVKKPLVSIDKEAGVRETSVGKFVPYSLVITNNENQEIKNLYVRDTPPAGFKLVDGSLQIVKNGEKTDTILKAIDDKNAVKIGPFNLGPKEQIEVVYLTKVSIGVVRGVYKNVAIVQNSSGKSVSNEDSAEVDVVEDPLFETTTVIGKVFHDRDGDGTQDDNRATKIKVKQNIPESSYVPNSSYYVIDGVRKALPDRSVPLERGIDFKEILHGRMSEREILEKSKIEIFTGLNDISELGDIRVTTAEGTDVTLTKDNKVTTNHTGLKAKGMVSQNIVVRKEILKRATNDNKENKIKYYQKITLINTGLVEEGMPGVRVANVEGLVIITDQYGRFHIPEVSSRKGKNYILKVDPATLPTGSIFTTENPKVQRLGTTMIKYNFGVILPRTTYETNKDGTRLLRVRVYPGVMFYDNSTEIKPVVYKKIFDSIASKLKAKDHLLVELNRSGDKELDEKRREVLIKSLKEYLDDKRVEVQFAQNKKGGM
ncbi:MAG: hypothetical protein ACRCZ9_05760, partial [Fusobacteriaceae bacterium]